MSLNLPKHDLDINILNFKSRSFENFSFLSIRTIYKYIFDISITYPEGLSCQYIGMGAQNSKYAFVYTYVFCCFYMILHRFQARKHTLSIANHFKAWKICSLQGFHPTDDCQHFNMELLGMLQSLQNHL